MLLLLPITASAQFIFLDSTGDGAHSADDRLNLGLPTVVDVFLRTDMNRDGSSAVCGSGDGDLTINSYEFNLHADGGTVDWGTFENAQDSTMTTSFGVGSTETDFHVGFGGAAAHPPGLYRLGRLTITITAGAPTISIEPTSPLAGVSLTSFGSRCSGSDGDNTLKLGPDWHDTGGLSPPLLAGFLRGGSGHMLGDAQVESGSASSSPVDSGCPQNPVACDFSNKPSVVACGATPAFASRDTITYFFQNAFGPIPNCDINVEVRSDFASGLNTGGHCHNETNRPVGTYSPASGNSGGDGLQFKVIHEWPEVAGRYHVVVSTSGGPCGTASGIYTVCIRRGNSFSAGMMALIDGPGYERTGGAAELLRHPDHHYGTPKFIEALKSLAREFAAISPGAPILGYNDMSLRWGGLFDSDSANEWHRGQGHCGHRNGDMCDMRTHNAGVERYTGDQIRVLKRLVRGLGIRPIIHLPGSGVPPHWHLQPITPGSFN